MKLVWITDPHLSFLARGGARAFGASVREDHRDLDGVIVTGDIGEYSNFDEHIERFAEGAAARVWFVLGNHDAYGGSVASAQLKAGSMTGLARWLPGVSPVPIGDGALLVGHDGFYDGRHGVGARSPVFLSDFLYIEELRVGEGVLLDRIQRLADRAAVEAGERLEVAIASSPRRLVFATHVPPFREAAWHAGVTSNGDWLPWMTSKVMGDMLLVKALAHPEIQFEVLCGHTHGSGEASLAKNLLVRTGDAEYRFPRVCGVVAA